MAVKVGWLVGWLCKSTLVWVFYIEVSFLLFHPFFSCFCFMFFLFFFFFFIVTVIVLGKGHNDPFLRFQILDRVVCTSRSAYTHGKGRHESRNSRFVYG